MNLKFLYNFVVEYFVFVFNRCLLNLEKQASLLRKLLNAAVGNQRSYVCLTSLSASRNGSRLRTTWEINDPLL